MSGNLPNPESGPSAQQPHRGIVILILGILGLLTIPLLGLIAWVMGYRDLARMKSGEIDVSGWDLTRAGKILGVVACFRDGFILALLFGARFSATWEVLDLLMAALPLVAVVEGIIVVIALLDKSARR